MSYSWTDESTHILTATELYWVHNVSDGGEMTYYSIETISLFNVNNCLQYLIRNIQFRLLGRRIGSMELE